LKIVPTVVEAGVYLTARFSTKYSLGLLSLLKGVKHLEVGFI
jgi:hypothetical protein